jgi:AraC-like DNA-binding protein
MKAKPVSMTTLDCTRLREKLAAPELLDLSTDRLAAEFGCSRAELNRLVQDQLGYSLSALRLEMRLTKAAGLLRKPGSDVDTIAVRCGFRHAGLFSACFERRFGVRPADWSRTSLQP